MLDQAFIDDCPYDSDALFIDDLLNVDIHSSEVICRMTVREDMPLTRSQRTHPLKHPRHLAGGLIVHMTGMLGLVHAYYVLGLRHADGWIGYGSSIHNARFCSIVRPGEELLLRARTTEVYRSTDQIVARYLIEFHRQATLVYAGDQTGKWTRFPG
jgi:hypothetical protein